MRGYNISVYTSTKCMDKVSMAYLTCQLPDLYLRVSSLQSSGIADCYTFSFVLKQVTAPQDAHRRLALQVYLGLNALEFSAVYSL